MDFTTTNPKIESWGNVRRPSAPRPLQEGRLTWKILLVTLLHAGVRTLKYTPLTFSTVAQEVGLPRTAELGIGTYWELALVCAPWG